MKLYNNPTQFFYYFGDKTMTLIKGILVSAVAPMSDHIANGGDKILGNASSIKRRPDGRVYISGQKQRHALFSAMERLNDDANTYVSNGDGVTINIETDLRADLGGYLQTSKETYSGRRTAPLSATPAVAIDKSNVGRDLLIRLKVDETKDSRNQALATREFSEHDEMLMSFFIDVGAVGIRKRFGYEQEMHLRTEYVPHITNAERLRRIRLALESTASLTDYANQARNATSGEPQKVLIVFDTKLSRKAARYFSASEIEQVNILQELKNRGAWFVLGDDTSGDISVDGAYRQAVEELKKVELYNPVGSDSDNKIKTSAEFAQVQPVTA
jgi:CRISPR-associated protein Cst2